MCGKKLRMESTALKIQIANQDVAIGMFANECGKTFEWKRMCITTKTVLAEIVVQEDVAPRRRMGTGMIIIQNANQGMGTVGFTILVNCEYYWLPISATNYQKCSALCLFL